MGRPEWQPMRRWRKKTSFSGKKEKRAKIFVESDELILRNNGKDNKKLASKQQHRQFKSNRDTSVTSG